MALNGIDIASYQSGIDLATVPLDFAIVKATQGTGYTNPDYARAISQVLGAGRLGGAYHYVSGGNAQAEADHFVDVVGGNVGRVILAIDWEQGDNSAWGNVAYLDAVVARVIERTGVKPLIYCSQSVVASIASIASARDCGLWVAQYANMNATGYQDSPWNEGAYSCVIRQYSSAGRLNGWAGNLDLDKFYGDAAAWAAYATATATPTAPVDPLAGKSDEQLAAEVIAGTYGDGDTRKAALGARYDAVQAIVNAKLADPLTGKSDDELAREVIAGKFGDGNARRQALGSRYDAVQAKVNELAGAARTYTVQAGDTLSAIAAKYGMTWQALAQKNGLANPNLIYPGQVLSI